MSRILSWDVGIKNLAYCVIERDKSNDLKFNVLDLGTINLVDDTTLLCECKLRGGNNCQNVAKYKISHNEIKLYENHENGLCVCVKHKAKIEPSLEIIESNPKSKTINKKNCMLCDSVATCTISNIDADYSWCDVHKKKGEMFVKKIKAKKLVTTNCNRKPMQLLAEKLVTKLDAHENFMQVDKVIIENQPSLINITMKTISSFLYMYFVKTGIVDKKNNSTIESVDFIAPSNKLKVNEANTNNILGATDKTKIYRMTKKLGVKYCEALLDDNWKKTFGNFKKKDDPADAFLAGLKSLFENELPQEYIEKLKSIGFEEEPKKPAKKSPKKNKINVAI